MTEKVKHWVTVIETDDPTVYDGPRVAVFHTREEAEEDVCRWMQLYWEGDPDYPGSGTANGMMAEYTVATGRFCKIEEIEA